MGMCCRNSTRGHGSLSLDGTRLGSVIFSTPNKLAEKLSCMVIPC